MFSEIYFHVLYWLVKFHKNPFVEKNILKLLPKNVRGMTKCYYCLTFFENHKV